MRLLGFELVVTISVLFPLICLIDFITPLRAENIFDEDSVLKIFFIAVFLVPLFEEFIFRYILRYSGIVKTVMSRESWDKVFPYLVYSFSIAFGIFHVSNYDNSGTLFYIFAPILVLSQLIGGFVLTYLRVRLNFWWAWMYHAIWNFLLVILFPLGASLFNKPLIVENNSYHLTVEEKPFIDNKTPKLIKIDTFAGNISKIEAQQYLLQPILDSLCGKGVYYANSYYINLTFRSTEGLAKDKFVHLCKEEFDIIILETEKRLR